MVIDLFDLNQKLNLRQLEQNDQQYDAVLPYSLIEIMEEKGNLSVLITISEKGSRRMRLRSKRLESEEMERKYWQRQEN